MRKTIFFSIASFFALLLMLTHADYAAEGARYGLLLWYQSVVPALFPFMVLSGLIVSMGGVEILMKPVHGLLRHIFPISKNGCYVLISGLLCGYPMGAKTCADFERSGQISYQEASYLMSICNHPSPMFLLGYVYPMFQGNIERILFLISIYGPVLIIAFLAKRIYFHNTDDEINANYRIHKPDPSCAGNEIGSLDETILSAVRILCKIGGYLVLFSVMILFLRNTQWIPPYLRLALISSMEITTGVRELIGSLNTDFEWICVCAALAFGGLSGIMQTNSVLKDEKKAGLSIRPYILWKLLHAVLSAGIAAFLCRF